MLVIAFQGLQLRKYGCKYTGKIKAAKKNYFFLFKWSVTQNATPFV